MSFVKLARRVAVAAAAVATLAAVTTVPAHASTTPLKHYTLKRGMSLEGFNAAVAKAHGYKIVTYADGDQQSVPVNSKSGLPKSPLLVRERDGVISPDNSGTEKIYGNCGYSFITSTQTSTNHIEIQSGFGVAPAAIYYQWFISLNDANGSSTQSAGGYLAGDLTWTGTWKNLYQYEYSIDEVLSDDSYATLDNGEVCSSAGPYIVLTGLN
jgi:hypothetical protein